VQKYLEHNEENMEEHLLMYLTTQIGYAPAEYLLIKELHCLMKVECCAVFEHSYLKPQLFIKKRVPCCDIIIIIT
jgi:hypothetical protein